MWWLPDALYESHLHVRRLHERDFPEISSHRSQPVPQSLSYYQEHASDRDKAIGKVYVRDGGSWK